MKKTILSLAATLMIAGCGDLNNDSTLSTSLHPDTFKNESNFTAIAPVEHATVVGVDVVERLVSRPGGPDGGLQPGISRFHTVVTLGFSLGCSNELASVSSRQIDNADGTVDLFVSAFEKVDPASLVQFCTQSLLTKKVMLEGKFSKDQINVKFTQGRSKPLTSKITSIVPTGAVSIARVSSLCPEGSICTHNGTVIDLVVTTSGCLDDAILSKNVKYEEDGKLSVIVGALNLGNEDSKRVRCFAPNTVSFSLTLSNQYFDKDDIVLKQTL